MLVSGCSNERDRVRLRALPPEQLQNEESPAIAGLS